MNIKGKTIDFSTPRVMGVLNVTPDSFYDGGRYTDEISWLKKAEVMIMEGADIIDIGTVSTRPGAEELPEGEEIKRLLPVLKSVRKAFPQAILSVDTWRSDVARMALEYDADMINDISGGTFDEKILKSCAQFGAPMVLMHIQGKPRSMQSNPVYKDVVEEVATFLEVQARKALESGVPGVIIDPGFGFGKDLHHNYKLLNHLFTIKSLGYPVMVGISRKSMINRVLGTKPENALNGTTAAHMIALMNGADFLRVHDVKEAVETVKIYEQLRDA
jgi:dihydropteroate synthase